MQTRLLQTSCFNVIDYNITVRMLTNSS